MTLIGFSNVVSAHGVDDSTRQFLISNDGVAIIPYMYIGAKHMLTGYDHILFLIGVIFFLFKPKDVVTYVTFFTIGHSLTLMYGVLSDIQVNAFLIDAIIGLSIVYKGFDNLGGFRKLFGFQPNTKLAVLIFGLFHGFGLATKIQEFKIPENGLVENLISFNIGVELGQIVALILVLTCISIWRRYPSYFQLSTATNTLLMSSGLLLAGYQFAGFILIQ